jgi:hypothetical protein
MATNTFDGSGFDPADDLNLAERLLIEVDQAG